MGGLRKYRGIAALFVLLAAGLPQAGAQSLTPGTEVFAVDPAKVIEIIYRTPEMMLLGYRWQARDRFTLIFLDKQHHQPATCLAGKSFDIVLNQLTSLKLRRVLDVKESQGLFKKTPLTAWAEVVVRDQSALEPFRALILPGAGAPDEAYVHFNNATYVVSFADRVRQLIAGGCRSLTAQSLP